MVFSSCLNLTMWAVRALLPALPEGTSALRETPKRGVSAQWPSCLLWPLQPHRGEGCGSSSEPAHSGSWHQQNGREWHSACEHKRIEVVWDSGGVLFPKWLKHRTIMPWRCIDTYPLWQDCEEITYRWLYTDSCLQLCMWPRSLTMNAYQWMQTYLQVLRIR